MNALAETDTRSVLHRFAEHASPRPLGEVGAAAHAVLVVEKPCFAVVAPVGHVTGVPDGGVTCP